ncbi:hypothetical protein [Thalassotalea sp. PS06]|uniref:hypothetical protein n=1 Tax=Thalassotalea sp. PS06 TaxID=2594005 RepID=UPI00116511A9|nr:hypothetical protein [Thalassotalea sp. PS06]QDP02194.1 hypothetical protein FNC98_13095 [Thalassotalea sp. PS06]
MNKKTEGPKCKDTKRLVKLASESGMTNAEIAVKAGLKATSISLVTRWKQGKTLATERQMAYFRKEFGELLRRQSENLISMDNEGGIRFVKLNGDVFLKHTVRLPVSVERRSSHISLARLVALQNNDVFHLLIQYRKGFNPQEQRHSIRLDDLAHCDLEDANWLTFRLMRNLTGYQLIENIDLFANDMRAHKLHPSETFEFSAQEIQYSVRKKLLHEGMQAEDIFDFTRE